MIFLETYRRSKKRQKKKPWMNKEDLHILYEEKLIHAKAWKIHEQKLQRAVGKKDETMDMMKNAFQRTQYTVDALWNRKNEDLLEQQLRIE